MKNIGLEVYETVSQFRGYDEDLKSASLKARMAWCRAAAKEMGLEKPAFDLHKNEAGIAVLGDVTLHTDQLYVSLSYDDCCLFRSCKGRKDYTGGHNQWMPWQEFAKFSPGQLLRRMMVQTHSHPDLIGQTSERENPYDFSPRRSLENYAWRPAPKSAPKAMVQQPDHQQGERK